MTPLYSKNKEDLQIQEIPSHHLPPHLHREAELILVTGGTLELGVETELYHMDCGDLAIVFPNQVHHFQVFDPDPSKCKALHLWFSPSYFGAYEDTLLEKSPKNPVTKKEDIHPDILYALKNLRADFEEPGTNGLASPIGPGIFHHHRQTVKTASEAKAETKANARGITDTAESATRLAGHAGEGALQDIKPLMVLSHAWVQIILSRLLPVLELAPRKDPKDYGLIYQVVSYIAGHFRENISLTSMASDLGVSPYALSRLFSKTFHQNFNQYLNDTRLAYTAILLSDPEIPITEAYLDSGFQSQATFNRVFQDRFHITPREYRKEQLQGKV